ncbi:IS3 family transposase [Flavobacterium sp. 9]|nr:IS3 family transposase [Flavobacterium sp. 9]
MRSEVYEYIENWYNKKRRHSALGYKTIEEFDRINLR